MPPSLYVARSSLGSANDPAGSQEDEPTLVSELVDLPIAPDTPVATSPRGRFVGLADAIDHAPDVRDALLALSPDPRLEKWRRYRAVALAAPASWAMLVVSNGREVWELSRDAARVTSSPQFRAAELDPETAVAARARHARIDRAVAMRKVYVASEAAVGLAAAIVIIVGARRWRAITVAAGTAAALWWMFHAGASGRCFGGSALRELILACFGVVGAVSALALSPSETSLDRALKARLGLAERTDPAGQRKDIAATIAAVWAGLSLPFVLDLLRRVHVSDQVRASFFVFFCLAAFLAVLVWRTDGTRVPPRFRALALVAIVGFGVTSAADIAARAALGTVVEVQTCVAPHSAAKLKAVQEQSGRETTAARRDTQTDSFAWFIAVVAAPLAEEILYRGTLQRVARRIMGARFSMLLSAIVFGLAHSFAFQHAFYQHIGLGLAFAAVFELAGGGVVAVVACCLTHALWNSWLTAMPVF